jgi:lysophospholipase L1-like esterase
MKNILCFGDSNTYGYIPDGSGRYELSVRYPGVLQEILGADYHVVEEGLCGRTTIYEDPTRYCRKAVDYIEPCLYSHFPLDCIVIMLGTNDCKTVFRAQADEIKDGLAQVIKIIRNISAVPVIIVAPILLGEKIWQDNFDPDFDRESLDVSKKLASEYKKLATAERCLFLNAAEFAYPSEADQEHMTPEGHKNLAAALAGIIKNMVLA